MKNTDITIILDRSGSMQSTKNDAIGGFNSFIEEQKKVPGEAFLTLVQFDNEYELNYAAKPIRFVEPLNDLTYVPRGGTALVDAMGRTINEIHARVKALPKAERPNVVVVIITDGQENASKEWTSARVNELITKLRKKGYEFIFIGANQDAIATSSAFGIAASKALSYGANSLGTQAMFASVSNNIAAYRSTGLSMSTDFTADDKAKQAVAGV